MSIFTALDHIKYTMPRRECVTEMGVCEFTYDWTIKYFSVYSGETTIESLSFSSCYSNFDDVWVLEIDPSKQIYIYDPYRGGHHNVEHLSIQLQLKSFNNTSPLFTKCKISIHDTYEKNKEYCFKKFPDTITWDEYIKKSDLLDLANGYLQNNELKISCTITIATEIKNNYDVISTAVATQQLNIDLKKLLLNEQSTDVTIKVGEKSFRAIKGILAARSPIFDAMFDHEQFKEHKNNEVVIVDIDKDVFEEFLHFIYTDETKNIENMSMELLEVAEKYQVERLKHVCEAFIVKEINIGNAAKILIYADKYNATQLKQVCLEFIKNNLQKVVKTEGFKKNRKLHGHVFSEVLDVVAGVN